MSSQPDYQQLAYSMLSDLAFAVGYCEGTGNPSAYLKDRYSALTEILLKEES